MKKHLTQLLLGISLLSAASLAQADGHITLGRTILLENGNHGAKIPLIVCRKTDAIKVKAERNLHLERVKVTFQNGDTKVINFYRNLKKGQATKWRAFAYRRCVKKLEVFGNSDGSKAGVKILGRD